MILPRAKDAIHKAWLYRLLSFLLDDIDISQNLYFKGGTCASMLGWLDRFSVDLDFDLKQGVDKKSLRTKFYKIFSKLGLEIKDESQKALQFFLRYKAKSGQRNTLKLDIIDFFVKANKYEKCYLKEIDRWVVCQTVETMFSNKLVTVEDRYQKFKTIAGRDIYDIHYFFIQGFKYDQDILTERTGKTPALYLKDLVDFINKKVSQTIIDQDLNTLLIKQRFNLIRKTLKNEVLMFLQDEIKRIRS